MQYLLSQAEFSELERRPARLEFAQAKAALDKARVIILKQAGVNCVHDSKQGEKNVYHCDDCPVYTLSGESHDMIDNLCSLSKDWSK